MKRAGRVEGWSLQSPGPRRSSSGPGLRGRRGRRHFCSSCRESSTPDLPLMSYNLSEVLTSLGTAIESVQLLTPTLNTSLLSHLLSELGADLSRGPTALYNTQPTQCFSMRLGSPPSSLPSLRWSAPFRMRRQRRHQVSWWRWR